MDREKAIREMPIYAGAVRILDEEPEQKPGQHSKRFDKATFFRDHIVTVIIAGFMLLEGLAVGFGTAINVKRDVTARLTAEYEAKLEQYKADQARQIQQEYFLSGTASREAAINQAVDAVAKVISKLSTDAQKGTEACCILARVMSPAYPNSFQEVCEQPQQWMFYDPTRDSTFSQHDREIAEKIVRPYMEDGIVTNGLTAQMVYGEWSTNDFVLRDSYKTTSSMRTFRWGN